MGAFIQDLTFVDLCRLREICKRVYFKRTAVPHKGRPGKHMTDAEADKWIESMGPRVMQARIKMAVDQGMVK